MGETIKYVQYGCGRMGVHLMEYALEKGAELSAAFDHNAKRIGKDVSVLIGGKDIGIRVRNSCEFEDYIKSEKPDICIIATRSLMKEVRESMMICAENGVNAITTCEEAIFPWNSSPAITGEIDKIAKQNGCTISGSGANETQYGGLFALFGGNSHRVSKIFSKAVYNIDDYGAALAEGHGVGLTECEFRNKISAADDISDQVRQRLIDEGDFMPSYVWNTNGWLCDYLGLTVSSQMQKHEPEFADDDRECISLNKTIKAGDAIGMTAKAVTETREGIIIESECTGILYGSSDEDYGLCKVSGVPDNEIYIRDPKTVEMTCASIINRIPDVIAARPGFITTSKMPILKFNTVIRKYGD